jgi:hypothetical protein
MDCAEGQRHAFSYALHQTQEVRAHPGPVHQRRAHNHHLQSRLTTKAGERLFGGKFGTAVRVFGSRSIVFGQRPPFIGFRNRLDTADKDETANTML